MNTFKLNVFNEQVYGITIFNKFIDFRQWYYLYVDGIKNDSWYDVDELKYAILNNKSNARLWFEPIPKRITLFKRC